MDVFKDLHSVLEHPIMRLHTKTPGARPLHYTQTPTAALWSQTYLQPLQTETSAKCLLWWTRCAMGRNCRRGSGRENLRYNKFATKAELQAWKACRRWMLLIHHEHTQWDLQAGATTDKRHLRKLKSATYDWGEKTPAGVQNRERNPN